MQTCIREGVNIIFTTFSCLRGKGFVTRLDFFFGFVITHTALQNHAYVKSLWNIEPGKLCVIYHMVLTSHKLNGKKSSESGIMEEF